MIEFLRNRCSTSRFKVGSVVSTALVLVLVGSLLAQRPKRPSQGTGTSVGQSVLPNNHGQIWREYDLSSYTSRVSSTARPERAIVDWILRSTGTETWVGDPLSILSANKQSLRVYHVPKMQRVVSDLVDKFIDASGTQFVLTLRLATVASPTWRTAAIRHMKSIGVRTPGIDAWLLSKENAAVLLSQLRNRSDFRELQAPQVTVYNGQSQTISRTRPRSYTKSVTLDTKKWPGFKPVQQRVDEGYSLQISPLFSTDRKTIDAVIKCHIDQIERLVPVSIDIPNTSTTRQRVQLQVPQMVSWRLHERFRWRASQVLLLSCGVVAAPQASPTQWSNPFGGAPRADALLWIEFRGTSDQRVVRSDGAKARPIRAARRVNNRGRY